MSVGERAAAAIGIVLTALWAGSVAAALDGRGSAWSERFPAYALHLATGVLVLAVIVNLSRRPRGGEEA